MSHMAPSDEHKSQLLIILGALLVFLSIFLLLSSVEREAASFGEASPTPRESQAEPIRPTDEPTRALTPTPTAYLVALPEVQGAASTAEASPSETPPPTVASSPLPSPSPTFSPAASPSATPTFGLRRPTRVPRPTPP